MTKMAFSMEDAFFALGLLILVSQSFNIGL